MLLGVASAWLIFYYFTCLLFLMSLLRIVRIGGVDVMVLSMSL